MKELFMNGQQEERFYYIYKNDLKLNSYADKDWFSLIFIIAGNERLYSLRHRLIDFKSKGINSEIWFNQGLSGGEDRLLALAYNLFTHMDYYELEDGRKKYISPLEVFSGLDEYNFTLAINALCIRSID